MVSLNHIYGEKLTNRYWIFMVIWVELMLMIPVQVYGMNSNKFFKVTGGPPVDVYSHPNDPDSIKNWKVYAENVVRVLEKKEGWILFEYEGKQGWSVLKHNEEYVFIPTQETTEHIISPLFTVTKNNIWLLILTYLGNHCSLLQTNSVIYQRYLTILKEPTSDIFPMLNLGKQALLFSHPPQYRFDDFWDYISDSNIQAWRYYVFPRKFKYEVKCPEFLIFELSDGREHLFRFDHVIGVSDGDCYYADPDFSNKFRCKVYLTFKTSDDIKIKYNGPESYDVKGHRMTEKSPSSSFDTYVKPVQISKYTVKFKSIK